MSSSHRRSWCHSLSAICRALSFKGGKKRSRALCVPVLALLRAQKAAGSPWKGLWARWGRMKERFLEGDFVGSKKKWNADTQTSKRHAKSKKVVTGDHKVHGTIKRDVQNRQNQRQHGISGCLGQRRGGCVRTSNEHRVSWEDERIRKFYYVSGCKSVNLLTTTEFYIWNM